MKDTYLSAIDIGSSHIAIVGCDVINGEELQINHALLFPSHGVDRGYISNIEQSTESLKAAISEFEKKYNRTINSALFSIGGIGLTSQYVRTSIEIKKKGLEIGTRDTKEVIEKAEFLFSDKYPNKKILHVFPISYKVDGRDVLGSPVGMFGSSLEVKIIMITVPEHHFEALINTIENVGINIEDIVAAPVADAFASLSYEQKKQGSVLVNIGSETTQMSTYEQGVVTSLKVVPLGSSDITNDLALGLQIPIKEAQAVKHAKNTDFPVRKVDEIKEARLIDIIELIEKHLKSIKKNRLLPGGAYWTGNGSLIASLNSLAKSILHIPSSSVQLERVSIQKKRRMKISPKYSVAFGLCKMNENPVSQSTFSFRSILSKIKQGLQQLKP